MKLIEVFRKNGGLKLLKQFIMSNSLITLICEFLLLGGSQTSLEILRLSTQLKAKNKLSKLYKDEIRKIECRYDCDVVKVHKKIIWICWLQGIENAPYIVKECYKSICSNISDRQIILITEENYHDYIVFPEIIQKKIDAGIISGAHMTDLLRLELLLKYGGTWVDATVFCTSSSIPQYMLDSDLFVFQCLKPGREGHTNVFSNWFITASSNNKILFMIRELLYYYWTRYDSVLDYFIFHETARVVVENCSEEWRRVVPFSSAVPHMLLLRMFDEYDEGIWNAIIQQSPFHKLTYKFSEEEGLKEDTYYKHIIQVVNRAEKLKKL